jgi:hypothetical protein
LKIVIATPMYGGMCTGGFTCSVVSFLRECDRRGIGAEILTIGNESLIQRARNNLVHCVLNSDATHLFFIDADIAFQAADVFKMIEADKDIVCGMYPKKTINWAAVRQAVLQGAPTAKIPFAGLDYVFNTVESAEQDPKTGCVEVVESGTGFMLIKREVFEKLADQVDTYISGVSVDGMIDTNDEIKEYFFVRKNAKGVMQSEDYAFCEMWRNAGGKIWMAPWVRLWHIGTHVYG